MEAILVVRSGKRPGQEVRAAGPKFLIGRAEGCHLRPQSPEVSRRHCAILLGEGVAAVQDLKSRTGTFVNGQRVEGRRVLRPGDILKIGPLEFEVRLDIRIGGPKKPKVQSIQDALSRSAQSTRRGGDDMDIAAWIDDEEEEADTPPPPPSGSSQSNAGGRTPQTSGGSGPESKASAPKRAAAKPPPGSPPATTSSSDAAADILRRLSGRGP
jgi:predicted component of type VI protein secretion system